MLAGAATAAVAVAFVAATYTYRPSSATPTAALAAEPNFAGGLGGYSSSSSSSSSSGGGGGRLALKVSNEYPTRLSKHWYAWDHIVEPHKTTTLTAVGGGDDDASSYAWVVTHEEDGASVKDYSESGTGLSSVTFAFTRPAQVGRSVVA